MTTPIRIIDGLPFVAATLQANGQILQLEQVLLDTGSAGAVFKTDLLESIGVIPLPGDPLHLLHGIGGDEAVIEKTIKGMQVGSLIVTAFTLQLGAVEYGRAMDGILGLDFLRRAQAIIDFNTLELRP